MYHQQTDRLQIRSKGQELKVTIDSKTREAGWSLALRTRFWVPPLVRTLSNASELSISNYLKSKLLFIDVDVHSRKKTGVVFGFGHG